MFFSGKGKGGKGGEFHGMGQATGKFKSGKLLFRSGQLLLELELLEVNLFLLALETRCTLTFEPKLS